MFTLVSVRFDLAIVALRLTQRAYTDAERADLEAIRRVLADIEDARGYLQDLHPDHLPP